MGSGQDGQIHTGLFLNGRLIKKFFITETLESCPWDLHFLFIENIEFIESI